MIRKISDETIAGILRKSAFGLPDRPSDQGIKAGAIKEALYKPVVDNDYSVVSEVNRIVNEANAELQKIGKETKWFAANIVFTDGKAEIPGIGAKVGDLIISTKTGEIGIITAVNDGDYELAEKIMDNSVKWFILDADDTNVSCNSLPDAKVGDWILNSSTGAVMRIYSKSEDVFVLEKVFNVKGDQGDPGTKWHNIEVEYDANYAPVLKREYPFLAEGDYVVSSDGNVGIVEEFYEGSGGVWPIRFIFSLKGERGETGPQGPSGATGSSLSKLELVFDAGTVNCIAHMSDNSTSTTSSNLSVFLKGIVDSVLKSLPEYGGEVESGGEVIPDDVDYKSEAENVIDRVTAFQTGRVFTFAAITDMHYGNSSYTTGIENACKALAHIDSRIKLDAVAVLGDYTDGYLTTNYDNAIADFKGINGLMSSLRFAPNLRQQGNHDFHEVKSPLTHRFIQAHSDDVVWGDKLGGYYYKDFEEYKLRVVCVNANEENGIDNAGKPIGSIACSVAQYEWFINSLDLTEKDDVAEWQILILSHQPLDWYDSDAVYSFARILNAYKNGTSWENTILGLSCDYTNKNAATLIGNIHGHIHNLLIDNIHLGNVANGEKTDIWRISTPEACIGRANQYTGEWAEDVTYAKSIGTTQDTSFCIYCINLDTYTIDAICYGAGYDRSLNYSDGTQVRYYSITNVLTDVSTNNSAVSVLQGQPYTATLSAEGEVIVTVTMGGVDITAEVFSDGVISIPEATGNVVITASVEETEVPEEPVPPTYTNQIPISTDTDGSVYNGKGFLEDTRLNSSGATTTLAGTAVTGFIPVAAGDVIRFKNVNYRPTDASVTGDYIALYDGEKNNINSVKSTLFGASGYMFDDAVYDDEGYLISFTMSSEHASLGYAYMRLSCNGLDGSSVITVNELIE